ncbi:MAG: amidohydrolase family protein [Prolixibacteraceae bacterium]|nr:amidohydrolase family protein [Prolixibacteraceae bacterium]
MRKIAATYIFPGNRPPVKNGIVVCRTDGTIVEIIDNQGQLTESPGLEYYSGILVPGFVNAHCHLELSHLKNKIEEKTGIGGFIGRINQLRNVEPADVEKELQKADRQMWAAGIVAVGDIVNSLATLDIKLKSKIQMYTFVESFGFHPSRAERSFKYAKFLKGEFRKNDLPVSIVPHSPYSVSELLFKEIRKNALSEKSLLTIHNQESKSEAQFYKNGTGDIATHLQQNLGIDISHWNPPGESSLAAVLKYLPTENQLLLVHNTFTGIADLQMLKKKRSPGNTFFVLCPNSNLYIENQLPPVSLFQKEKLNICLGTDSLASNHQLSVFSEMVTLQQHFPEIELSELVDWACINGARALKMEKSIGSFEPGKKPGINLISGIDFKKMKLTANSKVKKLL